MRNSIVLSLFLGLFLIIPISVSAQEKSQRWVCLERKLCSDSGSQCSGQGIGGHRVRLSVKPDVKLIPNSETYIVECLETKQGQICTTGNSALDNQLYSRDNFTRLKNDREISYDFKGFFNRDGTTRVNYPPPLRSNNAGVIGPYEWESYTPSGIRRKFLALNFFEPQPAAPAGASSGQKQGTFDFEIVNKDCVSIAWDPYGRVFDSQSLEPIPGSEVTLHHQVGSNFVKVDEVVGGIFTNPQTTLEDGGFSFVVPDNLYKLVVSHTGYRFPVTQAARINPGYARMYSDIYPALTGEVITQRRNIEHRDIPLEPLDGRGKSYPLTVKFFYEITKNGKGVVDGRASHPFATINAYSVKLTPSATGGEPTRTRYKLLKTTQADRLGQFKIQIDQIAFEQSEVFGEIEGQKTHFTGAPVSRGSFLDKIITKLVSVVSAQESVTIKLDPIPNYLEGYAYDARGGVIPNATVGVYLSFSNAPYTEVKADSIGYYKISSEYLPTMPYSVRYTSPTGTRSDISAATYLAQNSKTLESNKTNPYIYRDSQGQTPPEVNPTISSRTSQTGSSSRSPADQSVSRGSNGLPQIIPGTVSTNQSNILLLLTIFLVFIGVVGLILGVYLFNKNRTSPPQM